MAEYNQSDYPNQWSNGDAFLLNSRCIIALGESMQAMPAIASSVRDMIHSVCHPDSEDGKRNAAKIHSLMDWIWSGQPAIQIICPKILIPVVFSLDNTAK